MKSEKGFIQISLLTAIIISIVAVSVITTGIVLDKQKKTTPTTANISEVFEEVGEKVPKEELQEESQILEESQTESQPKKLINPTITTISPNEILSNIDATITINGENFRPGAILIIGNLISGENFGEVNIVSDKIITFEYPRGYLIPASYNITINNTDGSKITSDNVLKIIDAATQSPSLSQKSITEETELGAEPIKEEETKNKEVEKITGTEVGGIISENTTWTLENSPYILTSTVQIPSGVTLTIKPGVMVTKPTSDDMFLIAGKIYAHGTIDNKIIFDGGNNSDFFDVAAGYEDAFLDLRYCMIRNGLVFWPARGNCGYFYLQYSELINLAELSEIYCPSGNIKINHNKFIDT
ncbi:MAG: IPT/TIG domain-containing protein, partial [Nanoarchaeota archaeon]|nr:IPT/TIG domain-containing protein [Nanoarchaeota archaeon]